MEVGVGVEDWYFIKVLKNCFVIRKGNEGLFVILYNFFNEGSIKSRK